MRFSRIPCQLLFPGLTNKLGHLEFKAEILDESGNGTSADLGPTYRKLLCMAFDLAVLRAYSDVKFPRFVLHDYANWGIQTILTLIDSDLPARGEEDAPVFAADEIVLTLHDESMVGTRRITVA